MTVWDEARIDRLKQLWADGRSGSQIAELLGVSRCAILGKVNRLGLPGRATTSRAKNKRKSSLPLKPTRLSCKPVQVALCAPAFPILKSLVVEMKQALTEDAPPDGGKDLLDLKDSECHRVINSGSPWLYCGKPVPAGSRRKYCDKCYQIIWVSAPGYRRRTRPAPVARFEEDEVAA